MLQFEDLANNTAIQNVFWIVILFILTYVLVLILKKGASKLESDNYSKYKFQKIITFFGYLFFAIGLLFIFNSEMSGIGTALGVAGAGIAFALQEVIVSIAGYIAIFTSNFFKVGDRVKLGGIKGDVIDIGVLRTTLMEIGDWVGGDLYNGKMVRVANSFVFKEPVYNYSGDFPFLWDELNIPVKTGSDFTYAQEKFMEVLVDVVGEFSNQSQTAWDNMTGKYNIENAKVQPIISMMFDQNWMTFTLRYVVDYKSRRTTKSQIYVRLLDVINKSNKKIEIASVAMEITTLPKNI
ncbi:MAG: mechanosensitive ion channel [Fulvivirga sp.]|uniref:mechanosensitive ion channel family protein n=1 Tax=Fulvivirga sp. TaxID=1931237 RepID=UPI0032ECB088